MKFWNQGDKGAGARLFFEELQNQNARDIFAEKYNKSEFIEGKPLTVSHKAGLKKTERLYDFIFVRKELKVKNVQYIYDEAIAASSDHAAIIAEFEYHRKEE
ncbi:MAG: hypothetical protein Q4D76_20445 [Oscillospiraceae bacterium]|nr:hypothetical protein [Oscillospiraceae bacterium]